MIVKTTFQHIGPRVNCDEFRCARCLAVFLYVALQVPQEPHFITSDNPPQYCPECGAPRG
jgi:rubrerythrin